ncbi:hypothetical protein [Stutzerimonas nitrititolerans]|uniref:hypothetical protein n=1 Tax=Stutzerimonas nitrititolerans TaxID=2482751 RepID=UPI003F80C4DE
MKDNMFMALTTCSLNALVAVVADQVLKEPELQQSLLAVCGIASPFISLYLLKLYIKADDPPELIRNIAALERCIKICKKDLKDKSASPEFQARTRTQLEDFQTKLQNARTDFEHGRSHVITPFPSPDP